MEMVGLRELKLHLGKYVALARAGEYVIITRRSTPVAELRPVSAGRQALLRLLAEGKVTHVGDGFRELPELIDTGGVSLSDQVLEDRQSDWR